MWCERGKADERIPDRFDVEPPPADTAPEHRKEAQLAAAETFRAGEKIVDGADDSLCWRQVSDSGESIDVAGEERAVVVGNQFHFVNRGLERRQLQRKDYFREQRGEAPSKLCMNGVDEVIGPGETAGAPQLAIDRRLFAVPDRGGRECVFVADAVVQQLFDGALAQEAGHEMMRRRHVCG